MKNVAHLAFFHGLYIFRALKLETSKKFFEYPPLAIVKFAEYEIFEISLQRLILLAEFRYLAILRHSLRSLGFKYIKCYYFHDVALYYAFNGEQCKGCIKYSTRCFALSVFSLQANHCMNEVFLVLENNRFSVVSDPSVL